MELGDVEPLIFFPIWVRSWLKEQVFYKRHCWIAGGYFNFLMASEEDFRRLKNWSWYCQNHLVRSNFFFSPSLWVSSSSSLL